MLSKEFILFILVGIVNTLFGYAIFCGLIYLGLHYSLAIFLATCVGVVFNFNTIGKIVFRNSDPHLIGKFILVYVMVYCVNLSIVKLLMTIDVNIYFNGAIGMGVAALVSYFLNKQFVFASRV